MKNNSNLTELLPKSWYFIIFAGLMGLIVGYYLQRSYGTNLYGLEIVLALYSIGLIWAGLVVGFQIKSLSK